MCTVECAEEVHIQTFSDIMKKIPRLRAPARKDCLNWGVEDPGLPSDFRLPALPYLMIRKAMLWVREGSHFIFIPTDVLTLLLPCMPSAHNTRPTGMTLDRRATTKSLRNHNTLCFHGTDDLVHGRAEGGPVGPTTAKSSRNTTSMTLHRPSNKLHLQSKPPQHRRRHETQFKA